MDYMVNGRLNRYYEITDSEGRSLGRIDYPTWYAYSTAVITQAGKTYDIARLGIFKQGVGITSDGARVGTVKFGGWGKIIISREGGPSYTLKRVGFFNGYVGLFTEHGQEIIKVKQTNKWAFRKFTYKIETDDNYAEGRDIFLVLLLIFCIGLVRTYSYAS